MSDAMTAEYRRTDGYPALICRLLSDVRHRWSIGTLGAIGEFVRDSDEPATRITTTAGQSIFTSRGAIRIRLDIEPKIIAYDTLSNEGKGWAHALAFCLPMPERSGRGTIMPLGPDMDAVRAVDREAPLFDLGIGIGHVRFCLRTRDQTLLGMLNSMKNTPWPDVADGSLLAEILRAKPHRVLISPAGRIEVFTSIPAPDGTSPQGPHTHLLPGPIQLGRTHDTDAPIPEGFQPVLMMHPLSPWRDAFGHQVIFNASLDTDFLTLLNRYGLPDEKRIRSEVEAAVESGLEPGDMDWPETRRGRAVARLTLRRIAQRRPDTSVAAWLAHHDLTKEEHG